MDRRGPEFQRQLDERRFLIQRQGPTSRFVLQDLVSFRRRRRGTEEDHRCGALVGGPETDTVRKGHAPLVHGRRSGDLILGASLRADHANERGEIGKDRRDAKKLSSHDGPPIRLDFPFSIVIRHDGSAQPVNIELVFHHAVNLVIIAKELDTVHLICYFHHVVKRP
jgi:hypothetical protein